MPQLTEDLARPVETDWLVVPTARKAGVYRGKQEREIVMTNGLIRRVLRLCPNAATVGFDNLMTGASVIRGVKPEAVVELDGTKLSVGGLCGQVEYGYLRPEWLDGMTSDPNAFQLAGCRVGKTKARFAWKRKRYAADLPWPPPGASLALDFKAPPNVPEPLKDVTVSVHYEMYDGIPLLCKWLTIRNAGARQVKLNTFISEVLAAVEYEVAVESPPHWETPNIHVESDYAFHGMTPRTANKIAHWVPDPQYTSQVNYRLQMPVMLECRPPIGPDAVIAPGETFETFRTFVLIHDSTERERKGLALRRMYRTIAPWVTENPILMHVRQADSRSVRLAVDQCAEVGFEMVIMTFGSGFNAENTSPAYLDQLKSLADYAHGKKVELGGYSLLASRRISDEDDAINPKTGKPGGAIFGNSPCLGSRWAQEYFRKLTTLFEKTGMDLLEHDGSYPGDLCASTKHTGHRGLADSQWMQWRTITDFYKWCRGRGVYLSVPDWYFLSGSNKNGMGYREVNWSLPRARQIILGRQNIYDGTWEKTPSMGRMFVPLVQYHGGGAAATLEPLSEHLDAYEAHLAQNFGSGVQACYRGPRLYDTDKTKAVVKKWADFYKKYRKILDSDIIHVRRPDGRDIDCILHVNPRLEQKGLAMVYNPLDRAVQRTLTLPLYYTGLTETATVREREGQKRQLRLDRKWNVQVPVEIAPRGVTWLVIE
ncbi:MAG: alpha-galactosidase [Phycisphaerae bacterium]|nr:alpha-galactosidase [Phycisphaerae bacterium]